MWLSQYFRDDPHVYVAADLLLYYVEGDPKEFVVPDVFVVRGAPKGERRIYKLWEEGRAPDVVFEITSASTRREDLGTKRVLYADLGVKEYFVFDPTGEDLRPPLRAFRLSGSDYQPLKEPVFSEALRKRFAPENPPFPMGRGRVSFSPRCEPPHNQYTIAPVSRPGEARPTDMKSDIKAPKYL